MKDWQTSKWAMGSTAASLLVPAFGAEEKKQYKEGIKSTDKGYLINNPLYWKALSAKYPTIERVNKDSVDLPFLPGEVPALSINLIIHYSPQKNKVVPGRIRKKKKKELFADQPKDNLQAILHRNSLLTDAVQIQLHWRVL